MTAAALAALLAVGWAAPADAADLPPLPALLPATPWAPPAFTVRKLSNGVPLVLLPRRPSGTFDIRLVVRGGDALDPVGQEGLAAVAFDLADEGCDGKDAAAFAAAVRALGAEVWSSTDGEVGTVRIRGLARNVAPAVNLWAQAILTPAFAEADVALAVQKRIDRVSVLIRQPAGAADRVQAAVAYGDGFLGRSPTGTSLRAIDADAVRSWWKRYVGAANAAVVAGGDVDPDQLVSLLDTALVGLPTGEAAAIHGGPLPIDQETITFVDVPGAPQAALRAVIAVAPPSDPRRAALEVANEAVGGAFTSRLNLDLREDKGWTYGARCRVADHVEHGLWTCATLVRADVAGLALQAMRADLAGPLGEAPLTDDELATFKDAVTRSYAVDHDTLASMLAVATDGWLRGAPPDAPAAWLRALAAVDRGSAEAAYRAAVVQPRLSWVVAGDLATVRPQLDAVGLPIVVRDGDR